MRLCENAWRGPLSVINWLAFYEMARKAEMEPPGESSLPRSKTPDELPAEMTTLRDEAVTHGDDLDAMLDAVTDPMVVYDLQAHIIRCNPAFEAIVEAFSQNPEALTIQERAGRIALRDVHGDRLADDQLPQHRLLQGERITEGDEEEVSTRDTTGVEAIFSVTGKPLYHGATIGAAIVFFRDITERKHAEQQLAEDLHDTQLLRDLGVHVAIHGEDQTLYQKIMAAAVTLTHADAGTVQVFNEEAQELELLATHGFNADMMSQFGRLDASTNTTRGIALATGERMIVDFDAPEAEVLDDFARLHREAGYLSAQSTPLIARSGKVVGIVTTHWRAHHRPTERELRFLDLLARQAADIIERHQAELELRRVHAELEQRVAERTRELEQANKELRRLSQRILEVQESERRVIARELHDEIGQQLTGVKMLLETLESDHYENKLPETVGADSSRDRSIYAPHLAEISAAVATTLEQVRDLSLDLRPAVLDSLGLLPALQWRFERYTRQTGVRVDFSTDGLDHRLPAHLEAGVYRLIQEALTNVTRHAGVAEVIVQIYVTEEALSLYVVDAGAGFDVEEALAAGGSTGLAGMRERADLLGGNLTIDSLPGEGTTIQANFSITRAIEMEAAHETHEDFAYAGWQTPEDDAARHRARDELRDRARDRWRDAARDARRDTVRDALRDVTRDAPRDAMQDQQRERKDGKP
jgi:PAS domain S-box-containing protein